MVAHVWVESKAVNVSGEDTEKLQMRYRRAFDLIETQDIKGKEQTADSQRVRVSAILNLVQGSGFVDYKHR